MSDPAINLGTIYATIALDLQQLQTDAKEALATLDEVKTQASEALTGALGGGGKSSEAFGAVTTEAENAATAIGEVGAAGVKAGEEAAAGGERAAASLREAGNGAKEGAGGVGEFLGKVAGIAGAIGTVELAAQGFEFLKEQVSEMLNAGMEANQVAAQTVAGLKSTHDASGQTAESIDALSTKIMQMTGIDDDAVHSAANMLLTFENIGKDIFPQATQSVADLATKMAGGAIPSAMQMQQAAIQLGKALGDPTKGYAQLQRVGVTFTTQQVEQIKQMQKAGDVAGAQKVILAEMNKEFGGSAAAAGQANGGLAILRAEMENVKQTIGQALIPVLDQLTGAFAPIAQSAGKLIPEAIQFLQQHADDLKAILAGLGIAIVNVVIPALLTFAPAAWAAVSPILAGAAPVIALGAALAGLILLFKHAMDTSAPFAHAVHTLVEQVQLLAVLVVGNLQDAFSRILPYLQQAATWVGDHLEQAFQNIVPHLTDFVQWLSRATDVIVTNVEPTFTALGDALVALFQWMTTTAIPAIQQFASWLGDHLGPIIAQVAQWVQTTLLPALAGFAQWVTQTAIPAIQQFATWLDEHLTPGFTNLQTGVTTAWNVLQPIWSALQAQVQPILAQLSDTLQTSLIPAWDSLKGSFDEIKPPIMDVIALIGEQLGPLWQGLQPVLKIVGAILGVVLITAIGLLVGALTGIIAALGQVIEGAIKFAGGLIEAIGGALEVVTSIVGGFFSILFDVFHGNWSKIGDDLQTMWGGISDGLQKVVGGIWTAIQGLFQAGIGATLAALQGFVNGFAGAIDAIAHALGVKGNPIPMWSASGAPGGGNDGGSGTTTGSTTGHGRVAAYARGTAHHPGGVALVGEEGPELVHLPAGASVLPAGATAALLSGLSGWGVPGYAGGIGDFIGALFSHLGDGPGSLIQQALAAANVSTKSLTGVLGQMGGGTLSALTGWATKYIGDLLNQVTSTALGNGPVTASQGTAPGLLPGFPLMNQLAQHDVNDTNDCVPTSMASAASFLLKRLVSPVAIKDDVYGSGYVGGQAPDRYRGEMGKLGLTLQDAYGGAQSLIATIIAHLRAGQPVLGSIPSNWNVISQGGPTHEVAFAGYDGGKDLLTAMNPWRGFFQTASPAWWAPRLQYGVVNPLVKLASGGVLREAVAGIGMSSGAGYLMGERGPEAVVPLGSHLGGDTYNITVEVVASPEDGAPYQAGVAFGNGFAAGFQQARTQRGL